MTIPENSNDPDTWNLAGQSYESQRDYANALRCYTRAIELNPNFLDALKRKAFLCIKSGMFEDADWCTKRINEINENRVPETRELQKSVSSQNNESLVPLEVDQKPKKAEPVIKKQKAGEIWVRDITLGLVVVILLLNLGRVKENPAAALGSAIVFFIIIYALGWIALFLFRLIQRKGSPTAAKAFLIIVVVVLIFFMLAYVGFRYKIEKNSDEIEDLLNKPIPTVQPFTPESLPTPLQYSELVYEQKNMIDEELRSSVILHPRYLLL